MDIAENLKRIKADLPGELCLVAVSKTKADELILEAYETGHRDFGENKVQDLAAKAERLPMDIHWHFIGHLQSNKVKYIAPFVHMVHAVDSLKLLSTLEKEAAKNEKTIEYLFQLKIAQEESKFGMNEQELSDLIASEEFRNMKHTRLRGLMGMASYTENREQIRTEFQTLNRIFDIVKGSDYGGLEYFDQRSYGMSGDYQIAVEEGSTMVRIGSLIFGLRSY